MRVMRVLGRFLVCAGAALALAAGAAAVAPAASAQVLVDVEPSNGASLTRGPSRVLLVFAEPLAPGDLRASLTTPAGTHDVTPAVVERTATVPVPADGPGDYVLEYDVVPGAAGGQVGFTVLAPGQDPPVPAEGSPWWFLTGGALIGVLAVVLLRTVRGLRTTRRGTDGDRPPGHRPEAG